MAKKMRFLLWEAPNVIMKPHFSLKLLRASFVQFLWSLNLNYCLKPLIESMKSQSEKTTEYPKVCFKIIYNKGGKFAFSVLFLFLKKLHSWSSYENSAIHVYSLDRTKFCTEVYFDWVLNTITLQKRDEIVSE